MFFLLDHAFHRALAPVVQAWAAWASAGLAAIPRPSDQPRAHTPGRDSDRVLVLGAGPAVGWGVSSHELALPGALARALTTHTGRSADVNVISDPGLNIRNTGDVLDAALLWRYDAIVLTLGVSDALAFTSIRVWEKRLAGLLGEIAALALPSMQLFVIGIQPIRSIPPYDSPMGSLADRHAAVMNRVSSALCSGLPQVTFLPLSALPKQKGERFRSPDDYTRWGRDLAVEIAPVLDARWLAAVSGARLASGPVGNAGIDARQRAVEDLDLAEGGRNRRLEHIVGVAQRVFGTQIALFTVLDGNRQRNIARAGTDLIEIPLADSFCKTAIGYRDGMVVPDARQDPRFRDNPLVRDGLSLYAGYPIECPSGTSIGSICVLDPEPRAAEEVDLSLLREMAMLIQRELWRPMVDNDQSRRPRIPASRGSAYWNQPKSARRELAALQEEEIKVSIFGSIAEDIA